MFLTRKKNQYAIRAIFELAKRRGKGPTKISEIARAQAIPVRFLEVILGKLKGSGFVSSKRGFYGGYSLVKSPDRITVGDLIRFLEGNPKDAHCMACDSDGSCPASSHCAFLPMWNQVRDAVFEIFDGTTIQDLLNNEKKAD